MCSKILNCDQKRIHFYSAVGIALTMMYGGNTVFDSFTIIVTLFLTLSNAFLLSRNLNSGLQYAGRDGLLRIHILPPVFQTTTIWGLNREASFPTNWPAGERSHCRVLFETPFAIIGTVQRAPGVAESVQKHCKFIMVKLGEIWKFSKFHPKSSNNYGINLRASFN